jgi:hypothetical protein
VLLVSGCSDRGGGATRSGCADYRFDEARWRELREDGPGSAGRPAIRARRRLAVGLVRCRGLDGFTRVRVRRLLGEPEVRSRRAMAFRIGEEPGSFSVDPEYLVVEFDDAGRVETYDVERH